MKDEFTRQVADVLEVGEIGLDDDFRKVEGWCSLKGFGLLVLMENDWAAPLDVTRFLEMKTVRDLETEAFLALAADVFGVSRAELSPSTRYGSIPSWDSVNHLRLVMMSEKRFGWSFPIERIPALDTLGQFMV